MSPEPFFQTQFIRTRSGLNVDICFPTPAMFDIEDIAHGLSRVPRWAGQTDEFYSVAEHSIEASRRVHPRHALAALMHDACEFILGDVPRPLKILLPDYKRLENNMMEVISLKFGFQFPFDPEIKQADTELLRIEYKTLFLYEDRSPNFRPMASYDAYRSFLTTFYNLTGRPKNG